MSSICSSGRTIGDCLEHFERYTCVMKARFLDQDWVAGHQGRPDLIWCLYGTGELVMEQLHGMSWDPKLTRFLPEYVVFSTIQFGVSERYTSTCSVWERWF
ncbi:hypothetical protein ARMSODRAFT_960080 [Armillaria solidipes]|uniref:Uncharacterized protein n=1 Tax=Armillaria solidipes TaxID=1076256 RepID=A0A2H3BA14_9AGAR|nr:hypothetical protein ARMSODRAFT_960080 [Armillaria solidipes]